MAAAYYAFIVTLSWKPGTGVQQAERALLPAAHKCQLAWLPQIGGPCRIQDEASYMVCSGEQQKDVTEQASAACKPPLQPGRTCAATGITCGPSVSIGQKGKV
jgi:hypothetical protein